MISQNFIDARSNILNPNKRGWSKAIAALDWTRRWGYSSPLIIDQINGEQRRGLSKRLVEAGLLKSTVSASGGYFKDVPRKILTLTPKGLEILSHAQVLSYGYDFNKNINQAELRHHHLAQKVTMDFQLNKALNLHYFLTEIDRNEKSMLLHKQPDVIVVLDESQPIELENGIQCLKKIAIEVELTGKYQRAFDQANYATLLSLEFSGGIDEVHFYFDSLHQLERYKQALTPGNQVNIWDKNERGYWVTDEFIVVPEYVRYKIQFKMIS